MRQYPFPPVAASLIIYRVLVALFMMIHAITRIVEGSIADFGGYFNEYYGIQFGFYLAWAITIIEIAGNLMIIFGNYVFLFSLIFIAELIVGIIMVHAEHGWFVVGGGRGGVEYSALLIVSYLLLAATAKHSRDSSIL